ncbi:MAG: zf-HC2 domain-containing protein [Anaeromyxobacter sp.]
MTHHFHADLTAYVDGALSEAAAAALRAHLAGCPGCAAEETRLRAALRLLSALPPPPEPSPFFATRLEARLRQERERRTVWQRFLQRLRWRLAIPVAAVAAAALAAVLTVSHDRAREQAIADELDLLVDYEAVASVDEVATPEDAAVIAQLDALAPEGRP